MIERPPRSHCKHGHSLDDAYRSTRSWVAKKTGVRHEYEALVCRECLRLHGEKRSRERGHKERPAPDMPTQPEVIAYTAGLFDGEGSVGIRLLRKKGASIARYHQVAVAITSTEPDLLVWLQGHFGGRVNQNHKENAARNYKDAWKWQLLSRHAEAFLRVVRPYLIVKAQQADVALELRAITGRGRDTPVTPELFAQREKLHARLRELNRRGRLPIPGPDAS